MAAFPSPTEAIDKGEQEMIRRYFDNAATSFPKPPGVAAAMLRYMTECGGPGRGAYEEARRAGSIIRTCRERINRLVNGEDPDHVVFTLNTTDALNLAIKGVVERAIHGRPGARVHVVSTRMEHNSVLRPMNALTSRYPALAWTRVPADPRAGVVCPGEVIAAIRPGETALVIVNHASNVTGSIQPVEEIGRACRERGVVFLVDGAQSLGHIPVDVRSMNIDLLAFPGHKGLLGPTGTGGLYIRPGVQDLVATVREGGTGSASELETHPIAMPDRYEAGSHNAVGIAGLSEGVAWLLEHGVQAVRAHESSLIARFLESAASGLFPGLRLLGSAEPHNRVGVLSFVHEELDPIELATLLESEYGILTRSGLHCAPLAHATFGTSPPGGRGAVRLSLGPFLSHDDVKAAIAALQEACRAGTMAPIASI